MYTYSITKAHLNFANFSMLCYCVLFLFYFYFFQNKQIAPQAVNCLSVPWCVFVACFRNLQVPAALVEEVVGTEERAKYAAFCLRSFVENNDTMCWCIAPRCDNAIECLTDRAPDEPVDVICRCSATFCFNCKEEAHRPVRFFVFLLSFIFFVFFIFSFFRFVYYSAKPNSSYSFPDEDIIFVVSVTLPVTPCAHAARCTGPSGPKTPNPWTLHPVAFICRCPASNCIQSGDINGRSVNTFACVSCCILSLFFSSGTNVGCFNAWRTGLYFFYPFQLIL